MKSINYSGWIRSLFRYAPQRSDPTLKSDDLLLRKTGELQLRKIDDFKFAIYNAALNGVPGRGRFCGKLACRKKGARRTGTKLRLAFCSGTF